MTANMAIAESRRFSFDDNHFVLLFSYISESPLDSDDWAKPAMLLNLKKRADFQRRRCLLTESSQLFFGKMSVQVPVERVFLDILQRLLEQNVFSRKHSFVFFVVSHACSTMVLFNLDGAYYSIIAARLSIVISRLSIGKPLPRHYTVPLQFIASAYLFCVFSIAFTIEYLSPTPSRISFSESSRSLNAVPYFTT